MSASDESQLDARAKPVEANDAESSPTIDHDAAESSPPSSLRRKFKLYGALVAILVIALLAAAGAYPYWRTNASLVLGRVGLDLENLEMSINVPRWAITHVGEPRQDDIQDAEARVSSSVPSKPIASQSPVKAAPTGPTIDKSSNGAAEWRDATWKWAERTLQRSSVATIITSRATPDLGTFAVAESGGGWASPEAGSEPGGGGAKRLRRMFTSSCSWCGQGDMQFELLGSNM